MQLILSKKNLYSGEMPIGKEKRLNISIKKGSAVINLNRNDSEFRSVITAYADSHFKLGVHDFHFLEILSDDAVVEYEFQ